jgi:DNA-binding NarL/FixJ family response regulator
MVMIAQASSGILATWNDWLFGQAGAPPVPVANPDAQERRLLLLEDEPGDVLLAEELLEDGMPDYRWRVVDQPSLKKALPLLRHVAFDVALVDLGLRDTKGAATVTALHAAAPRLPIIVYSGTGDHALLEETLWNGARCYLEKGKTPPQMLRAVIRGALAAMPRY